VSCVFENVSAAPAPLSERGCTSVISHGFRTHVLSPELYLAA
jgi:hypothetical protein